MLLKILPIFDTCPELIEVKGMDENVQLVAKKSLDSIGLLVINFGFDVTLTTEI